MNFAWIKGLVLGALLMGLAACGGGSGTPEPAFDIQASALKYAQPVRFTVTGSAVDKVDSATVGKCENLATSGTAAQKVFTCTVKGSGELLIELRDAQKGLLFSKTYQVPEPRVRMSTSLGNLVVELNPTAAPLSVANFIRYVNDGFYTNTLIHRVIANFVVQGGWLTTQPEIQSGQREPIALESNNGLSNLRGTIAMARTSQPDSATSQFYFNLVDNTGLDYVSPTQPGYAVFGKVVEGLTVMDAIAAVQTGSKFGLSDVPLTDVVVLKAEQVQ